MDFDDLDVECAAVRGGTLGEMIGQIIDHPTMPHPVKVVAVQTILRPWAAGQPVPQQGVLDMTGDTPKLKPQRRPGRAVLKGTGGEAA